MDVAIRTTGSDRDNMGLVTLDGSELDGDPGRLLVEAKTSSLFGERRVVRRPARDEVDPRGAVEPVAPAAVEGQRLVLHCEQGVLPREVGHLTRLEHAF